MKTARITRTAFAVLVILGLSGSVWAATCEVLSYQKISDTEGNFNVILMRLLMSEGLSCVY